MQNRMQVLPEVTKNLLIINVLMFVGTLAIGNGQVFYNLFALYFATNNLFHHPIHFYFYIYFHHICIGNYLVIGLDL